LPPLSDRTGRLFRAQLDDELFVFEPPPGAMKIRMVTAYEIYEE